MPIGQVICVPSVYESRQFDPAGLSPCCVVVTGIKRKTGWHLQLLSTFAYWILTPSTVKFARTEKTEEERVESPDDFLFDRKYVFFAGIYGHTQPVHVAGAKGFDAGKVRDPPARCSTHQRLVDAEIVRIAVCKQHRSAKTDCLLFQYIEKTTKD